MPKSPEDEFQQAPLQVIEAATTNESEAFDISEKEIKLIMKEDKSMSSEDAVDYIRATRSIESYKKSLGMKALEKIKKEGTTFIGDNEDFERWWINYDPKDNRYITSHAVGSNITKSPLDLGFEICGKGDIAIFNKSHGIDIGPRLNIAQTIDEIRSFRDSQIREIIDAQNRIHKLKSSSDSVRKRYGSYMNSERKKEKGKISSYENFIKNMETHILKLDALIEYLTERDKKPN